MKTPIIRLLSASILASASSIVYQTFYQSALACDFSKIINPVSIAMATIIGCSLMELGYLAMTKLKLTKYEGWLYILIGLLSFLSIIGAMGTTLPLDIQNPELFPGLIAPLHLFPGLSYITISSLLKK